MPITTYDETTTRAIAVYNQQAAPTMFLTGYAQSPPQNFHNTEQVTWDIVRGEENVAVPIQDLSAGWHRNSNDLYTTKSAIPPIFKESGSINAFDMIKRLAGNIPFEDPRYQAAAAGLAFDLLSNKCEPQIRRSIEQMTSQILQTGKISLVDASSNVIFEQDFKPKATHSASAAIAWNAVGNNPIADLSALAEVVRNDGLVDPDTLIFGSEAWDYFMQNAEVQKLFDLRRADRGTIAPMQSRGEGGLYRGTVEIGNYKMDVLTYGGRFIPADSATKTQYIDPANVIMKASGQRIDLTFGAIPEIVPPDGRVLSLVPTQLPNAAGGMNLTVTGWISEDNQTLHVGCGTRPMVIPTAIDQSAVLDSGV